MFYRISLIFSDGMLTNFRVTANPEPFEDDLDTQKAQQLVKNPLELANILRIDYKKSLYTTFWINQDFLYYYKGIDEILNNLKDKLNSVKKTKVEYFNWTVDNIRGQVKISNFDPKDIKVEIYRKYFNKIKICQEHPFSIELDSSIEDLKTISFVRLELYLNKSNLINCSRKGTCSIIANNFRKYSELIRIIEKIATQNTNMLSKSDIISQLKVKLKDEEKLRNGLKKIDKLGITQLNEPTLALLFDTEIKIENGSVIVTPQQQETTEETFDDLLNLFAEEEELQPPRKKQKIIDHETILAMVEDNEEEEEEEGEQEIDQNRENADKNEVELLEEIVKNYPQPVRKRSNPDAARNHPFNLFEHSLRDSLNAVQRAGKILLINQQKTLKAQNQFQKRLEELSEKVRKEYEACSKECTNLCDKHMTLITNAVAKSRK